MNPGGPGLASVAVTHCARAATALALPLPLPLLLVLLVFVLAIHLWNYDLPVRLRHPQLKLLGAGWLGGVAGSGALRARGRAGSLHKLHQEIRCWSGLRGRRLG